MQNEFEAKVLNIDKTKVRDLLKSLGATLVFPERLFKRFTFETEILKKQNAWVRLRDEGEKISLTLKKVGEPKDINSVQEILLDVSNFDQAAAFLQAIGLEHKSYQENLREEWKLGDVVFDIDTWPKIPTYLEIEADSEDQVKQWFTKLGFDYSQAVFGSVDILYRDNYGIEILGVPKLIFVD